MLNTSHENKSNSTQSVYKRILEQLHQSKASHEAETHLLKILKLQYEKNPSHQLLKQIQNTEMKLTQMVVDAERACLQIMPVNIAS